LAADKTGDPGPPADLPQTGSHAGGGVIKPHSLADHFRDKQISQALCKGLHNFPRQDKARLSKILNELDVPNNFEKLVRAGYPPCELAVRLIEPVKPAGRTGDAELRKAEKDLASALLNSLKKTRQLARDFKRTIAPLPGLEGFLKGCIREVRTFAELKRPKPLFNERNNQQFRLLERVRALTRQPHHREVAELLCAIYTAQGIPENEFPTQGSLKEIENTSNKNRASRQAKRSLSSSTRPKR
jgi:hypothetical protein